ncbi:MAG TPA: hypothetical protein VNW90_10655 [Acetobacteraceae bacterium]|jgi:hypothetical protein|nr:hypothetical protein [Acetobacteraceae bacterium]
MTPAWTLVLFVLNTTYGATGGATPIVLGPFASEAAADCAATAIAAATTEKCTWACVAMQDAAPAPQVPAA